MIDILIASGGLMVFRNLYVAISRNLEAHFYSCRLLGDESAICKVREATCLAMFYEDPGGPRRINLYSYHDELSLSD